MILGKFSLSAYHTAVNVHFLLCDTRKVLTFSASYTKSIKIRYYPRKIVAKIKIKFPRINWGLRINKNRIRKSHATVPLGEIIFREVCEELARALVRLEGGAGVEVCRLLGEAGKCRYI